MKANELMIGDLVTFKDCQNDANPIIIKIWQVSADGDAFAFVDGWNALDEISIDDEVVGIPLTAEILENNGFIYNEIPFVQGWEQYGLTLTAGGDGFRVSCGQNTSMIIDSVHELQHALRLCGIEHNIMV